MAAVLPPSCTIAARFSPHISRTLPSRVADQGIQTSSQRHGRFIHPPSARGCAKAGHELDFPPKYPLYPNDSVRRNAKTVRTAATSNEIQSSVADPGHQEQILDTGDFKWERAWYPVGRFEIRMHERFHGRFGLAFNGCCRCV